MIPIVVVLGATGTGKSKLAIELCKVLGGEIINADAVQCYQGLPIMTNKATEEETSAVPHHLLGFVDPVTQKPLGQSPSDTHQFDVHEWTKLADSAVQDIHRRGKVPVVVGGTHYYIESLIWRKLIDQESIISKSEIKPKPDDELLSLEKKNNEELYEMLRKVDPVTAERLHPNNRRKVIRSLTIFHTTQKPQSEIIRESPSASVQRYNPFFIWVDAQSLESLDPKLDKRVDEMLDRGLLTEVSELKSKASGIKVSFERGIFQSIGLRQFWDISPEEAAAKGPKYAEALESMKACTRRYARQQHRWIKNRLEKAGIPLLHLILGESWEKSVFEPALDATKTFLKEAEMKDDVKILPCPLSTVDTNWKKYDCETCKCQLNGENEWVTHLKSKKHKHFLKLERKKKKEEEEEKEKKVNENKNDDCPLTKKSLIIKE